MNPTSLPSLSLIQASLPIGMAAKSESGAETLDFSTILDTASVIDAALAGDLAEPADNLLPAAPPLPGGKDGNRPGNILPGFDEAPSDDLLPVDAPVGTATDPAGVPIALAMILPSSHLPPSAAGHPSGLPTAASPFSLVARHSAAVSAPSVTRASGPEPQPHADQPTTGGVRLPAALPIANIAIDRGGVAPSVVSIASPQQPLSPLISPLPVSAVAMPGVIGPGSVAVPPDPGLHAADMPGLATQVTPQTPGKLAQQAAGPIAEALSVKVATVHARLTEPAAKVPASTGASPADPEIAAAVARQPYAARPGVGSPPAIHQPDAREDAAQPVSRVAAATPPGELPASMHAAAQSGALLAQPAGHAQAATVSGETPQDFATLVSRLVEAREAASPQVVHTSLRHAEFGTVALQFRHEGGGLAVTMASPDVDLAASVQAALAGVPSPGDRPGDALAQQQQQQQGANQQAPSGNDSRPGTPAQPTMTGQGAMAQGGSQTGSGNAGHSPQGGQDTARAEPTPARGKAQDDRAGASPGDGRRGGIYA